jgi:hypothetical protein
LSSAVSSPSGRDSASTSLSNEIAATLNLKRDAGPPKSDRSSLQRDIDEWPTTVVLVAGLISYWFIVGELKPPG